jgi:hypothetical protein
LGAIGSLGHPRRDRLITAAVVAFAITATVASFVRALRFPPGDFEAYYAAASAVRHGDRIYDRALAYREARLSNFLPGIAHPADVTHYVYPPPLAMALTPFTLLPLSVATAIWTALSFFCLIMSCYLLRKLFQMSRQTGFIVFALLIISSLVYQPARATLASHNADFIVLFLVVSSLHDLNSSRLIRSGLWLALAVVIKPPVGFILLAHLVHRSWRSAASSVACCIGLLTLSVLVVGFESMRDFFMVSSYRLDPHYAATPMNQSIYGILLRLFTHNTYTAPAFYAPWLVNLLRYSISVALILVNCWFCTHKSSDKYHVIGIEYGFTITVMLLISPLSEDVHFTYLIVPMVAAAAYIWHEHRPGRGTIAAAVGLLAVYLYLSMPGLRTLSLANYRFFVAPIEPPASLLTGMHFYGLVALTVLVLLIGAPGRSSRTRLPAPPGISAVPTPSTASARSRL